MKTLRDYVPKHITPSVVKPLVLYTPAEDVKLSLMINARRLNLAQGTALIYIHKPIMYMTLEQILVNYKLGLIVQGAPSSNFSYFITAVEKLLYENI